MQPAPPLALPPSFHVIPLPVSGAQMWGTLDIAIKTGMALSPLLCSIGTDRNEGAGLCMIPDLCFPFLSWELTEERLLRVLIVFEREQEASKPSAAAQE